MKTDIHSKDFARRLALKERLKGIRKWSIPLSQLKVLYRGKQCKEGKSRREKHLSTFNISRKFCS